MGSYTVRKITSYNLYRCILPRHVGTYTDYNLQITVQINPANMLYSQISSWINTDYNQD